MTGTDPFPRTIRCLPKFDLHLWACEEGPMGRLIVRHSPSTELSAAVEASCDGDGPPRQISVSVTMVSLPGPGFADSIEPALRAEPGFVARICQVAADELRRQMEEELAETVCAAEAKAVCERRRTAAVSLPYLNFARSRSGERTLGEVDAAPASAAQLLAMAWKRRAEPEAAALPAVSRGAFQANPALLAAAFAGGDFGIGLKEALARIAARHVAETANVEWAVTARGESVNGWLSLPPERSERFFDAFAIVSLAVQKAMRFWLPALWLARPEDFDIRREARSTVFYSCVPARRARNRCAYTYDPMDKAHMQSALEGGRRGLPGRYAVWAEALEAAGSAAAAGYRPDHPYYWKAAPLKAAPRIKTLLAVEGAILDQLVGLGAKVRSYSQEEHPKRLERVTREFLGGVESRIRRIGHTLPARELAQLLFVYATAALGAEFGLRPELRVALRIRFDGMASPYVLQGKVQTGFETAWEVA